MSHMALFLCGTYAKILHISVKMSNDLVECVHTWLLVSNHFPPRNSKEKNPIYPIVEQRTASLFFSSSSDYFEFRFLKASHRASLGFAVTTLQHCKLVFSCRESPEKTLLRLGHLLLDYVVLIIFAKVAGSGNFIQGKILHESLLNLTF